MVEDTGGGTRKGNGIPATATNTAEGVTTPNLLQHPAEVVRPNNIQSETMVTIMVLRDTTTIYVHSLEGSAAVHSLSSTTIGTVQV
jgi:hypothetical protein